MVKVKENDTSRELEEKREQEFLENVKGMYRNLMDEFGEEYCLEQIDYAKQRVMATLQTRDWKHGGGALEASVCVAQAMEKPGRASARDPSIAFALLAGVEIVVPGYLAGTMESSDSPRPH